MADASYIVDIILRARDDTAAAFASAAGNQETFNQKLREGEELSRRQRNEFVESSRQIIQSQRAVKESLEDVEAANITVLQAQRRVEQQAQATARAESDQTKTVRDQIKAHHDLNVAVQNLYKTERDHERQLRASAAGYKTYRDAMEEVARLRKAGEEQQARELRNLVNLDKAEQRALQTKAESLRMDALRQRQLEQQEVVLRRLEQAGQKYAKTMDSRQAANFRKEIEQQGDALERLGMEATQVNKLLDQTFNARKLEQFDRAIKESGKALDRQFKDALSTAKEYERQLEKVGRMRYDRERAVAAGVSTQEMSILNADIDKAERKLAQLAATIKTTSALDIEINVDTDTGPAIAKMSVLEAIKGRLGRDVSFDVEADIGDVVAKAAATEALKRRMGEGPPTGIMGWFRNLGEQIEQSSNRIATFDNFMRGLFTLGIAVFFNQLVVLATAAAGSLVALAGSAVMAGGALGGAFVSGLMQAIPALGVFAAAIGRVKAVMEAVQQAGLVDQQKAAQAEKGANAVSNAADTIRNAEDALADAHRRVADAQEGVTEARERAAQTLQDLILAEREADLAARGAVLSQSEAQEALQQALSRGDTGAIARARLRVDETDLGVDQARLRRSRVREDLADRRNGKVPEVEQAQEALTDAQRGADRAARSLERAKRSAETAGEAGLASAAKLEYLLGRMSDAERGMFTAITKLQEKWREVSQQVTEPLILSFTTAIERVTDILDNSGFVKSMAALSEAMAKQFDRFFDHLLGDEGVATFIKFADEAAKNLKPLTDIAINLSDAFSSIGIAAMPALREFLSYFSDLTKRFADWTSSVEGQTALSDFFTEGVKHFKAWMSLLGAVGKLFFTIINPKQGGGATTGLQIVEGLTDRINKLQKAAASPEGRKFLQNFFDLSKRVLRELEPLLVAAAKGIAGLFDEGGLKSVRAMASIFGEVLIPAFGTFLHVLGLVAQGFGVIAENPVAAELMKLAVAGAFLGGIFVKILTVFRPFWIILREIFKLVPGGSRILTIFGNALRGLAFNAIAGGARTLLMTLARFTLITGVIALVGTLLKRMGLLDDFFRMLGKPFVAAWRQIKPAIQDFLDAIDELVGSFTGGKGLGKAIDTVLEVMRPFVKFLIDVMGAQLTAVGKIIGSAIATPFRVAAGLIRVVARLLRGDFKGALDALKGVGKDIIRGIFAPFEAIGEMFVEIFRKAWKAVKDFLGIESPSKLFKGIGQAILDGILLPFATIGKLFEELGSKIVNAIIAGIRAAPNIAKAIADKAGGVLSFTPAGLAIKGVKGIIGGDDGKGKPKPAPEADAASIADAIAEGSTLGVKGLNSEKTIEAWRAMWKSITTITRRGANGVEEQIRDMRVAIERTMNRLSHSFRQDWWDMSEHMHDRLRAMRRGVSMTMDELTGSVYKGMRYIGTATNTVLKTFDADPVRFNLERPGGGERKAVGGFAGMPGERGGDHIPIVVGRGEAVLNWAHQKMIEPALRAFYGFGLGDLFNRTTAYHAGGADALGGFAKGGFTGPFGSGSAFTAVSNFAKKKFGLSMTAGKSNHSQMTSSGNVSDHYHGMAGDFSNGSAPTPQMDAFNSFWKGKLPQVVKQLIWRNKDQFNGFPIGGHMDHVHLALLQNYAFDKSRMARLISRAMRGLKISDLLSNITGDAAQVEHIDSPIVRGKKGPLRSILSAVMKRITGKANSFLDGKFGESVPTAPGGPSDIPSFSGPWVSVMEKIASAKGWSIDAWRRLIQKESGGNPAAVNPSSGAFGLGQFLGSTARAYAQFGALSKDPGRQIRAMAQYIGDRYGTPSRALAFHNANNWYSRGGPIARFARGGFVGGLRRAAQGYWGGEDETARRRGVKVSGSYRGPSVGVAEGDLEGALREISIARREIEKRIGEVKNLADKTALIARNMTAITKDGGLLDQIGVGIEKFAERLGLKLKEATFKMTKSGLVRQELDGFQIAEKQIANMRTVLRRYRSNLRRIEKFLEANNEQLKTVNDRIDTIEDIAPDKRTKKQKAELEKLKGSRENLIGEGRNLRKRAEETRAAIAEQLEGLFQAQMEDFQKRTEASIAGVSRGGANMRQIEIMQRIATANGNGGQVAALEEQRISVMREQQEKLRQAAQTARSRGYNDLADQFQQQFEEMHATIAEATAQQLNTAIEVVNSAAQRSLAGVERTRGQADLLARIGGSGGLLGAAFGGAFSEGGAVAAAQLRGEALRQEGGILTNQRAGLQGLLRRAQAEGNLGAVDTLTDQLADLDASIQENTVAQHENTTEVRQARIENITQRQQFQGGVFGGLLGIVQAIDSRTGIANTEGQRGLLEQQRGTISEALGGLQDQLAGAFGVDLRGRTGMGLVDALKGVNFDQIEAGLTTTDRDQFRDLINQIISLGTELEGNTTALQDLNGTMTPQTWSSTAWQWGRNALFSGMGETLPQFTPPPAMMTGSAAVRTSTFAPNNYSVSSTSDGTTIYEGDINIDIDNLQEHINEDTLAEKIAFRRSIARAS